MDKKLMFSSNSQDWETPQFIFDRLDEEFDFQLDAAASPLNHKVKSYLTKEQNALLIPWYGRVFVNPPYGRYITGKFVKKAYEETLAGNAELVVLLLPARTDTKWFHDYIWGRAVELSVEIRFIKGRVKFELSGVSGDAAPFPSMVVVMRR